VKKDIKWRKDKKRKDEYNGVTVKSQRLFTFEFQAEHDEPSKLQREALKLVIQGYVNVLPDTERELAFHGNDKPLRKGIFVRKEGEWENKFACQICFQLLFLGVIKFLVDLKPYNA